MEQGITTNQPAITLASFLRGAVDKALTLGSILTTCEHRNTHFPSRYQQRCYDCGRVRTVGIHDLPGFWHREVM